MTNDIEESIKGLNHLVSKINFVLFHSDVFDRRQFRQCLFILLHAILKLAQM